MQTTEKNRRRIYHDTNGEYGNCFGKGTRTGAPGFPQNKALDWRCKPGCRPQVVPNKNQQGPRNQGQPGRDKPSGEVQTSPGDTPLNPDPVLKPAAHPPPASQKQGLRINHELTGEKISRGRASVRHAPESP